MSVCPSYLVSGLYLGTYILIDLKLFLRVRQITPFPVRKVVSSTLLILNIRFFLEVGCSVWCVFSIEFHLVSRFTSRC